MEALLKKHFWAIEALGFGFAAVLATSAIATHFGTKLLLEVDDSGAEVGADGEGEGDEADAARDGRGARPQATRRTSIRNRKTVAESITTRNIFCPTCAPAAESATPVAVDADGRPLGPTILPGAVKSSLPLKLMATMESSDPAFSLATIYDDDVGVAGLYGQDDSVRTGVTVAGIDRGLVHLRNNSVLEYIEMGATIEKARPKSSAKKMEKPENKKNSRAIPGAEEAINCPSEDLCVVERKFVEQLMANPAMLAKQARVVPSIRDGETVGFKFYGIRRGTLPRLLGLKNGDLLTHVNGEELASMDKAMELYTKLRRASNLSVTIERKGKSMNKEIQIK